MAHTLRWTSIAFGTLLRVMFDRVALGERPVGIMSEQARNNLSQLTDAEISALYGYLRGLSGANRRLSADGVRRQ